MELAETMFDVIIRGFFFSFLFFFFNFYRSQFGTGEFSESNEQPLGTESSCSVSEPKVDYRIIKERLETLNRKKDVVCLILSYSMNMVDRARHKRWIQDVLSINQRVGDVEILKKRGISEDASEIFFSTHYTTGPFNR